MKKKASLESDQVAMSAINTKKSDKIQPHSISNNDVEIVKIIHQFFCRQQKAGLQSSNEEFSAARRRRPLDAVSPTENKLIFKGP